MRGNEKQKSLFSLFPGLRDFNLKCVRRRENAEHANRRLYLYLKE
jgi:hypothetical protein